MRIMVVLSRVPWPLEKGDKLRAYYLMKELAKKHEIILFCLADQKIHPMAEQKLKEFCSEIFIYRLSIWGRLWRLAQGLFKKTPFQVNYFYSKGAQKAFDSFLEEHIPQHIFCQLLRTAEFVRKYKTIPKSMDYMDALGAGMLKMAKASKWPSSMFMNTEFERLKAYELEIQPLFQSHYIISNQDLKQMPLTEKMKVIPNGVGLNFFEAKPQKKSIDILFSGNMNYRPNVESARFLVKEVMPIVWRSNPNLTVTIAGATPSPSVLSLKSDLVTITGWIDDIAAVYQQSRLFVAPMLINSGMQNKILEAMASKIPVITTSLANNAIKAPENEAILLGDNPEEIAAHINLLINDQLTSELLGKAGYDFVKKSYSWKGASELLASDIEDCRLTHR
jgi:polysaccharide biosynthesis protein PslH